MRIIKAKSPKDAQKIGIHLLNPSKAELDDARDRAESDGFERIYVHTNLQTWPGGDRQQRLQDTAPAMLQELKRLRDFMLNRGTERVDVARNEILQRLPLTIYGDICRLISRVEVQGE